VARAEVEAARAWGVPRSVFLGRPWPAPGESLWLDEDREWALALLDLEADTCPGCGQPHHEASDPANEGRYTASPHRCHACATVTKAVRAWRESGGSSDGLTFYVTKDR
jgi:hypothetical protein